MCHSIQHRHPKTKHRKLKNEIGNQTKRKQNTAKRKQKTKHRSELVVNINFWFCENHSKVLYCSCFQVSEHPTQTPENQTPRTSKRNLNQTKRKHNTSKRKQKTKHRNELVANIIFCFTRTIEKCCSVVVFRCQSIQHRHPKTKHRKLKNEIGNQTTVSYTHLTLPTSDLV